MPIADFDGDTFVAFADISGFKALMREGRGLEAIDTFYNTGYRVLSAHRNVNGFFVSDSGIMFARESSSGRALTALLEAVKELNRGGSSPSAHVDHFNRVGPLQLRNQNGI